MFRFTRLVLAATVIGAVGVVSLPWAANENAPAEGSDTISHVDWTNADRSDTWPPQDPSSTPSYDGDGSPDTDGDGTPDHEDDDPGTGPSGDGASPDSGRTDGGDGENGDRNESGGMLNLAFPVQAGMSVGLLALAFLALLPGRRMPADLR